MTMTTVEIKRLQAAYDQETLRMLAHFDKVLVKPYEAPLTRDPTDTARRMEGSL